MALSSYTVTTNGDQFKFIPQGSSRPSFEYDRVGDKSVKSDRPKTNDKGQPLHAVSALALLPNGDQTEVRISTPQPIDAANLPFGSILVGQGKAEVTLRPASDGFGLSVAVVLEGVAQAK